MTRRDRGVVDAGEHEVPVAQVGLVFLALFDRTAGSIKVGDPYDPAIEMGPVATVQQRTRELALLRAINLAGHKPVAMADLRDLLTGLGFSDPQSLLQSGNLVFRRTARNFNPAVIMAGRISVVEVEEIVPTGSFDPDAVHLPGIFVHRIVVNASPEKRIEQRTVRAQ